MLPRNKGRKRACIKPASLTHSTYRELLWSKCQACGEPGSTFKSDWDESKWGDAKHIGIGRPRCGFWLSVKDC